MTSFLDINLTGDIRIPFRGLARGFTGGGEEGTILKKRFVETIE
jgi:hypothetical protein